MERISFCPKFSASRTKLDDNVLAMRLLYFVLIIYNPRTPHPRSSRLIESKIFLNTGIADINLDWTSSLKSHEQRSRSVSGIDILKVRDWERESIRKYD
jgi:hypothetical protein